MPKQKLLSSCYNKKANQLLALHQDCIQELIPDSVEQYYQLLLSKEETAKFLTNELVEQRLQSALAEWLGSVLSPKQENELDALLERQYEIGKVHARINVQMQLVSEAMFVLKRSLHRGIINTLPHEHDLILAIHSILDFALININQVYFEHHNEIEHQAQIFRSHLTSMDFALEVEQMRSELHHWFSSGLVDQRLTPIADTDFFIWVRHKLTLAAPEHTNLKKIEALIEEIDALVSNGTESLPELRKTQKLVNDISWNLLEMAKSLVTILDKRDALTQLYNRRFLENIFLQETIHALKLNRYYSVMMLDIDSFKAINDHYGHQAGDQVLQCLGQIINDNTRITDFAFRYGGEEFLILLTECDTEKANRIGTTIANHFKNHTFEANNQSFNVTISIGISLFTGQPDFQHTINHADKALYQSKQNGRDQITIL